MTLRPALLICNPLAGGKDWNHWLAGIQASLQGCGFSVEIQRTRAGGHATELAAESVARGRHETVFGLGGDGTLREIASGLLGSPVPLAILPGGTTNVLALSLGVPTHAGAASRAYEGRGRDLRVIDFDVGLCGEHLFLMMVSAGIDSLLLSRTTQASKKRWGKLALGRHALGAVRDYRYPAFTLGSPERSHTGSFAVASNIRLYGGDFAMAPTASYQDGLLDCGVFSGTGTAATLGFYLDLAIGAHDRRPDVAMWRTATARLDGETDADGTAGIQLDGDPVRLQLPLDLSISPAKLKILTPAP